MWEGTAEGCEHHVMRPIRDDPGGCLSHWSVHTMPGSSEPQIVKKAVDQTKLTGVKFCLYQESGTGNYLLGENMVELNGHV